MWNKLNGLTNMLILKTFLLLNNNSELCKYCDTRGYGVSDPTNLAHLLAGHAQCAGRPAAGGRRLACVILADGAGWSRGAQLVF